jgi:tetratricopeptide (TPR) repeat protein
MTARTAAVREKSRRRSRGFPGILQTPRNQFLLLGICLVVATVALYYPVSAHPFFNYDDDVYVVSNPHVQAGLQWVTVKWAFTSFRASNWHPVTWISHALDCQMFGLDAGRHHQTNLVLHVINVVLLFWVLTRATGYAGRSAMVAALFALHPINIESVAWMAERKNLLSMMFFLLVLGAYRGYARNPGVARYGTVAALYALGLMAKPQVITLPFVLLLWDYWPLQRIFPPAAVAPTRDEAEIPSRSFSWLVMEKLPLLALSVASGIVTVVAQYESGSMTGPHWQPFPVRLENAMVAYARYLGKAFWPSDLAVLYPHPGNSLKIWQVGLSLLLLLAITAAAVAARHRRRYLLVGWLWFLGTLVPMIGLVQVGVQAMADRYAYLPFVGLFISLCWLVAEWAEQRRVAPAWQWGVSVAVLLALAIVARRQIDRWNDNNLLWWQVVALETQALQANPNNWVAEDVLGHALLKLGQVDEAVPHFRAAAAMNPSDPDSNVNVGTYEQKQNNLEGAIAQYQKVIAMTQSTPRQDAQIRAQAFSNVGYAYRDRKDYAQARASFQQAVLANPDDARSWLGLGLMAQKSSDLNAAIPAYTRAVQINSFDWGYLLLAQSLDDAGRHDEALTARRRAGAISPNIERAQKTADAALAK